MKSWRSSWWVLLAVAVGCFGCKRMTRVEDGNRNQILHLGNGTEPEDLDPHVVVGVQEDNILRAVFEGLVNEDPEDLHPVPGVAERWDISPDGRIYTFHLRQNATWSNGDPVTANDFRETYKRALSPDMANEYAYMFNNVVNAEQYYKGTLTNFNEVGFAVLDDRTLRVTLQNPSSYFLSLLNHHSWKPIHIPTVRKYGPVYERGSRWTRPGRFVGNGPFELVSWTVNQVIVVRKSPTYWDSARVKLKEIHFYAMESLDAEERAFRAGQIHKTDKLPLSKIAYYKEHSPQFLYQAPYLGTYFYMFNVTRKPFTDKRVRQALAMSINREELTRQVSRGGELPAYHFTPPNTVGYTSKARFEGNVEKARKLLAEAGYPDGQGFPKVELLYNTLESHKTIAEAVQQMWKENLHVEIGLRNEEWKVYLNSKTQKNYDIARYGWIADYVDPNAFLDMWMTDAGNNDSGWSNKEYDGLILKAAQTVDRDERFEVFQKAEAILLDEMPVIPIYFYTSTYLLQPSVKGWGPTILDHHPYPYVELRP
jgi:oligopeptide transport system substrate-binding protein